MEINKFVQNIAEQYDETTIAFTPETEYKALEEYSSLVALSIIAMIDDEYNKTLKGDDIRNSKTIQDLYNVVKAL